VVSRSDVPPLLAELAGSAAAANASQMPTVGKGR
jgi:hypothetical protein